jgi:hypothetical protein
MKKLLLLVSLLTAGVAHAQEPIKQEPAGCLQATAHTNGPCKITFPNGNSMATLTDGTTWFYGNDYHFQVSRNIGEVTGSFYKVVTIKIPQPEDIIEAPQFEKMEIWGNCKAKTYQVWSLAFTDANGFFGEPIGPETVTRRVMPDTPMAMVFKLTCVSALLSPGFQTYTNNRYGFRVDYPLTFIPQSPPDNGDGLGFKSLDGKATLDVSGANNGGFTLKGEFDSAIKNVHGQLGYNKTGGSWFVVTWTDGDNIGYTKEFVGPGSQNSFTITFPVEQKSQYDSVVTAIEKSFQPGDLDDSH